MNSKKKNSSNIEMPLVAAGVVGAVIGSGVAIALAIALKDKKNQDRAREVIFDIKDQVGGYIKKSNLRNSFTGQDISRKVKKTKKLIGKTADTIKLIEAKHRLN